MSAATTTTHRRDVAVRHHFLRLSGGHRRPVRPLLPADAYAKLLDIQNGVLMGIGVEVAQDQTGYAKVLKVYDGSPAQEAGIEAGNYITTIDDTDVRTMSGANAIEDRLLGEAGTTVHLVWLGSDAAEQNVDLTRSGYISTTIDYQKTAGDVGYIKIRQFDATTLSELDYAIRTLRNAGAASLLFDLRDNAGGCWTRPSTASTDSAPKGSWPGPRARTAARRCWAPAAATAWWTCPWSAW